MVLRVGTAPKSHDFGHGLNIYDLGHGLRWRPLFLLNLQCMMILSYFSNTFSSFTDGLVHFCFENMEQNLIKV